MVRRQAKNLRTQVDLFHSHAAHAAHAQGPVLCSFLRTHVKQLAFQRVPS